MQYEASIKNSNYYVQTKSCHPSSTHPETQRSLPHRQEPVKTDRAAKTKVAEAQHAVEQATKIYGNSDTTKQYKIELANAEAQLGRLQTQLAKTNKEILLQSDNMKKAGKRLSRPENGCPEKAWTRSTRGLPSVCPLAAAGAGLLKLAND